ncbi:MAG TPA: tetratricopeptide repeat protein [Solirubrobacterales bacterium]|nr:tetratricopeptide repeat protein [Solirubrobacterales bacterium]
MPALPKELAPFLAGREDAERGLLALAGAESLTDPLACDLLQVALGMNGEREDLVASLHLCDFVVERNSEWHLAPRIREALVEQLTTEHELSERVHRRLLELSEPETASADLPDELPRYLQAGVGRAYHATFLSDEGVHQYSRLADQPLSGQQWLAGELATEQVRLGLIPENALEVMFLQGMILYRERRWREAERVLRKVANRSERSHEVAVAAHLVGRMDGRRPSRRKSGESFLWKSLKILRSLSDSFGTAQVLHTLGRQIGRDRGRRPEAEKLLRESLEIEQTMDNPYGAAQVLHTLGQLVGRERGRRAEAEELLRGSLEIEQAMDSPFGTAQVLHTLGQMVGRDRGRRAEAEKLLRESLEILRALNDSFGAAQVLHTLGQLVGRDRGRRAEAEELLRESLEIGRDLGRRSHQAQVLYTTSQLAGMPPKKAEALLQESLELDRQRKNRHGEQLVERALQRLRKTR